MAYYKREADGLIHLYDLVPDARGEPKEIHLHAGERVAIAYSPLREDGTGGWSHAPGGGATRLHVFTHGSPEDMAAWVAAHNSASPHKAELWVSDDPIAINSVINGSDARGHCGALASRL